MVVIMNGGPAFPTNYFYDQESEHEVLPMPGMTLRDYFAAKALQGILTNGGWVSMYVEAASKDGPLENMSEVASLLSDDAYTFADAMLKERRL
jgi:hypothetical protein